MTSFSIRCSRLAVRPREIAAAMTLTLLAAIGLAAPMLLPGAATAQTRDRIVAAGGVVTEVLYALGLQDRIVGVDSTSQFPPQALRDKPGIGYVRALSAEGVLSLKPSLVIAIEGAGPPDAISLVNEAGVRLARISEDNSPEGVVTKIEAIGTVAGAAEPARRLAVQTKARFDDLASLRSAVKAPRRVLFVLSLQNGRVMVGGRGSTAASIIGLAGAINAAEAVDGYKAMSEEAIAAAAPDIVLMMANGGSHNATADELFALPAFATTPAAAGKSLLRMDALYLLGFGPRTPAAARDLMAAIYPEAAIPPLADPVRP